MPMRERKCERTQLKGLSMQEGREERWQKT